MLCYHFVGCDLLAFDSVQPPDPTPELDDIDAAMAPELARFDDAVHQYRPLYDRVRALATRVEAGEVQLEPAAAYWLDQRRRAFERAGVGLPEADQARLRELNATLAELQSAFGRRALAGGNAAAVHVTDEAELDGLSDATRAGARAAAETRGLDGWLL